MMTSDARKRLAEQTADHQIHHDPSVRDLIERERRKAAAEALREAAEQCDADAENCPDNCDSPFCRLANRQTAAWLRDRADHIEATR